ncbi:hypothetical protein OFL98_28540, partial [Escherichia coli]|nr:hypothetical protein [Escherichia coli]
AHGRSPSISVVAVSSQTAATAQLEAQLQSKSATIETMELEMSRLRAQVEKLSASASGPSEQIEEVEEKLARAEKGGGLAQQEVAELVV